MTIVSSTIVEDRTQADGRRSIREWHVDQLGGVQLVDYLAAAGANANTVMTARVSLIEANLRDSEINANIAKALNAETTFVFNHSTAAQNRTALRDLFKISTKWQLMVLGWVINSLALTDTQLKNLFSVTDAQLPALKSRLTDISAKYESAIALVGQ